MNISLTKVFPVQELEQESLIDYQVWFELGLPQSEKYMIVGEGENMYYEMTGMTIKLERKWFRYLVNYFIPSGIIAALSIVSLNNYGFNDDVKIHTLVLESVDTPRVFSTKTQDFTPMFLKSVVEVHLFLKGSK